MVENGPIRVVADYYGSRVEMGVLPSTLRKKDVIQIIVDQKKDVIWIIVDQLMNSAHSTPARIDYSHNKLEKLFVSEIIRLHGVPLSIISDHDSRFTSLFWGKKHEALGTKLKFNTALHLQTDGQSERSSIKMASYESLYGQKYGTPLYWTELNLILEIEDKVNIILDCLKDSSDRHKSYANLKRKDIEFQVGEKYHHKKSSSFRRKGKLNPKFIVPYEVIESVGHVAYHLALLAEIEKIHNVFHVSMLRRYRSYPSHPDVTYSEEPDRILAGRLKNFKINGYL
ncbi:DNA/RNA polymerases superfamily protein [Gossypium australe]|uniref:DNA/RNA polymerases superfamily protein n=1 Tax=Gossypium australe TaxID=47621 RepID=A0A5B6VP75_9ROSI|nr:DNA/RNA polymerases superfamily protein [Gossypium australe]